METAVRKPSAAYTKESQTRGIAISNLIRVACPPTSGFSREGNPTLASDFEDSAYYLNSNLQLIWKVQGDAKHRQLASYLIGGRKASDSTAKKTYLGLRIDMLGHSL